jgi:type IX secretion system PorP/SprF family membrane protein
MNRFEEGNGVLARTFLDVVYSHHVVINAKNRLYLGFQGGVFSRSIDWSKLVFPDQLDPKFGNVFSSEAIKVIDSRFNADFSGGIAYKHAFKKDYGIVVGVSSKHITTPEEGLVGFDRAKLPTRNTFHANVLLPMNYARENFLKRIVVSLVYQQQGPLANTQLGVSLKSEFLTFAVQYRYNSKLNLITQPDALTMSVRFQNFKQTEYRKIKSPFEFGVTHDITYNQIGYGSLGGSPELSFSYMPSGVECSGPVKGKKRKTPKFMRRLKVTGSALESKTKLEEYF